MKLARSGHRGVFWRSNLRGTQEVRAGAGGRQRGDWWIRWGCPHGHIHRTMVGPKGLAQKEAERRRIERSCPKRQPKPTAYLVRDVIKDYLDEAKAKRSYRDDVRYGRVWTERFGGRTLEEIAPADLERIKSERLKEAKPSTINRELAFLKHVYNVAIRDSKTASNPVSKIKLLREPSGRVRYLTEEEEARLMAVLPADADRQRIKVLLQTGLRKSEFSGLRWKRRLPRQVDTAKVDSGMVSGLGRNVSGGTWPRLSWGRSVL